MGLSDSTGPDIFKYKYTGQEYDSATRLYYMRARYYDPTLGRFLQADSQIMPAQTNGLNRYMYVNGNPMKFVDPSGHRFSTPLAWGIIGALTASQRGQTITQGFALGYAIGEGGAFIHMANAWMKNANHKLNKAARTVDRGIDGGVKWLLSGGRFHRNRYRNSFFGSLGERLTQSNLGWWITHAGHKMGRWFTHKAFFYRSDYSWYNKKVEEWEIRSLACMTFFAGSLARLCLDIEASWFKGKIQGIEYSKNTDPSSSSSKIPDSDVVEKMIEECLKLAEEKISRGVYSWCVISYK